MLKKLNKIKYKKIYPNIALSVGIKKEDFQNLDKVLKEFSFLNLFVLMLQTDIQNILNFIKSGETNIPLKQLLLVM